MMTTGTQFASLAKNNYTHSIGIGLKTEKLFTFDMKFISPSILA